MHEIITLQLGHRANYIATHFWNTQESYFTYGSEKAPSPVDHDIHFRAGLGPKGEDTFTPRTLIYDLKGGFGSMKKETGLYDESNVSEGPSVQNGVWNGNVVIQNEASIPLSEYQQSLDGGTSSDQRLNTKNVKYWSDYNRVFYHPRSIIQINDYELGSSLMPFEKWKSGEELFSGLDREVDILDRDLRFWAEECDHMQGIQILMSADDAWGGFGARYLERVRDEFGKLAIWVWGTEEEYGVGQKAKELLRTVNAAKSIHDASENASIYVPMSIPWLRLPPYIKLDRRSEWHISGLLSMTLETMTLPSRLRLNHKSGDFETMRTALNVNGNQRIANLQCNVIDPLVKKVKEFPNDSRMPVSNSSGWEPKEDELGIKYRGLDMDFFCGPSQPTQDHVFGQVESLRGFSKPDAGDDEDEGYMRTQRRLASLPIVEKYETSLQFPLLDSFPEIISQRLDHSNAISVETTLSTTSRISSRAKYLQKIVGRIVTLDDREALSNGLGEIGEAYLEGWDSGSDSDSDD